MLPLLRVQLFGSLFVFHQGVPVTALQAPRLQTLLAYLILHRGIPQPRHRVAFLLWPDSSEAQVRTNLRNLWFGLRHSLPHADHYLQEDRQTITWRVDALCTLDVADFEAAIRQASAHEQARKYHEMRAALEQAVALYNGELLPDCYDDWIVPARNRLHDLFIHALEVLIRLLQRQADYPEAIKYTRYLLLHDPLYEPAYRHLMRLYMQVGDHGDAIRTYQECHATLKRELAIEPSPATHAIYQRVSLAGTRLCSSLQTSDEPASDEHEAEWARLRGTWDATLDGRPQFVVIAGPLAERRTWHVDQLTAWAARRRITTAKAICSAQEQHLAYAPVATWLRSDAYSPLLLSLHDLWISELGRLLPELLIEHPEIAPPQPMVEEWQHWFFRALNSAFQLAGPSILTLDNLQWCDRTTIDWLWHALFSITGERLLIVATLPDEPAAELIPLLPFFAALEQQNRLTYINLSPTNIVKQQSLHNNTRPMNTQRVASERPGPNALETLLLLRCARPHHRSSEIHRA